MLAVNNVIGYHYKWSLEIPMSDTTIFKTQCSALILRSTDTFQQFLRVGAQGGMSFPKSFRVLARREECRCRGRKQELCLVPFLFTLILASALSYCSLPWLDFKYLTGNNQAHPCTFRNLVPQKIKEMFNI